MEVQGGPVFQLVIQFQPGTGQFAIAWPAGADHLMRLAMLEGAKTEAVAEVIAARFGLSVSPLVKVAPGTRLPS